MDGKVIFYADTMTGSMQRALDEMARRREKQKAYNIKHKLTPKSVQKIVQNLAEFNEEVKQTELELLRQGLPEKLTSKNLPEILKSLEHQMHGAAEQLDFETAALLRDQITEIRQMSVEKWKK